jgi:hypothetical protein
MGARHYGGEVDIWGIGYVFFLLLVRPLVCMFIRDAFQLRFGRDVYPQTDSSRHVGFGPARKDLLPLWGPESTQLAVFRPPTRV